MEARVRRLVARATSQTPEEIALDVPFVKLGLDSLDAFELLQDLGESLGRELEVSVLFDHPTPRKLIDFLTRDGSTEAGAKEEVPRVPVAEAFPLLGAQKTFFANHGFYPDLPSYVLFALDLTSTRSGALDPERLDARIARIAERHPMLRVTFGWEEGQAVHRPDTTRPGPLERHDLSSLAGDAAAQAKALEAIEHALRSKVFSLEEGPLARFVLCDLGGGRHRLFLSIHHVIADGWSAQVLLSELLDPEEDGPLSLPPPRTHFAECIEALETKRAPQAVASARQWWERTLEGAPALRLPWDGSPDAPPSGGFGLHVVQLDETFTERVAAAARAWGVTTYHVTLASHLLALARWSREDDLLVRVAQARRSLTLPDIDRVVGCFADSLPLRMNTNGMQGRALVEAVQRETIEAARHAQLSSLELAGFGGRGAMGPRGITPAGFSFPNFRTPRLAEGLALTGMHTATAAGFTQLGLVAFEFGGRLHLSWNFPESLFRTETVARMGQEHGAILRDLVAEALGERSKERPLTIHGRILQVCSQVPGDRVAIEEGARRRTYGELRVRVEKLSRLLAGRGAKPGLQIGIVARPGVFAVEGALGILASGAAYVPADPAYPDARIQALMEDAAVPLVVTTPELEARMRALGFEVPVVGDMLPDGPEATPVSAGPEDVAYVMYTSGTTGRPKGVVVTHAAVSSFHDWVARAFGVTEHDRFIQTSSLAFGGSIRQMFSPLLAGATMVPAPDGLLRDPRELAQFLERERITIWNSVPSLWRRLIDSVDVLRAEGAAVSLDGLRWILIGGEQVPSELPRRWRERFGTRHRIANLYGSTETIVNATWFEIPRNGAGLEGATVPIGRARDGSRVFVLDDQQREVPRGEVGELWVGGPSLADGYLNQPELTAQSFRAQATTAGRAYRTGDLVYRRDEGELVYVGRADDQVKIRGNRVELEEIEAAACEVPGVEACAVVDHTHGDGQWLWAFVQASSMSGPDGRDERLAQSIRAALGSKLPAFMVPHRIRVVRGLPLTAAGKLDRRALREWVQAELEAQDLDPHVSLSSEAALTPTEAVVADVWRSVLRLDEVSRNDDFFVLGGDSLLALDMFNRLRARLANVPRPITLYAERTVARLAAAIDVNAAANMERGSQRGVTANEQARDAPAQTSPFDEETYPLAPSQVGFVLAERTDPGRSSAWCAMVPVHGTFDRAVLQAALDFAVARHPMLRTVFEQQGSRTVQRQLPPGPFSMVVEDLRGCSEDEKRETLEARFRMERGHVFDLERLPLVHLRVLRLSDDESRWLFSMHHAVGDGWSVHLMASEVFAAYDAIVRRERPALPPLRANFGDVALHLRQRGEADARSRDYWTRTFSSPVPDVPLEDAEGSSARTPGEIVSAVLAEEETDRLREVAIAHGTTVYGLVLTSLFRAVRTVSGGVSDLTVGTAAHGRDLPVADIERMFGCFATALPVRAVLPGSDWRAELRAVDVAYSEACAHADLSASELARCIHQGGQLPGSDLFLSFMDFGVLPPIESRALRIDWPNADIHFTADSIGTRVFVGALCAERLRLNVHGLSSPAVRHRILDEMVEELRGLTPQSTRDEPIDSALVCYLPSEATVGAAFSADDMQGSTRLREAVVGALFTKDEGTGKREPALLERQHTRLGTTGAIFLPRWADELHVLPTDELVRELVAAVQLAEAHGARTISFAGMLPSLAGYGAEVSHALREQAGPMPRLTTGHAATSVAVVLTVERMLAELDVPLSSLDLAVVGFGSIGQSSTRLLSSQLGRPRSLRICERAAAEGTLRPVVERLEQELGIPIKWVGSQQGLPDAVYDADLIIGASSAGGLLEVPRLRSGALVADDSFPPLAAHAEAWSRMDTAADVIIAGAGSLDVGEARREVASNVPLPAARLEALLPPGMPGCRFESLLMSKHEDVPATLGLVDPAQAERLWKAVRSLGIGSAPLHLGPRRIGPAVMDGVRAALGLRSRRTG